MKYKKTLHLLLPIILVSAGCDAGENAEGVGVVGMNRLSDETSPYLLAHADNPVNWYAWGEAAFAAAETQDKPIFLSIGYSSCHWCHVMEEESFEDLEVAALLNESFICIKVDREERPDIDNLYMRYTVALTGGGGWPMTVFLTCDGKPFFAGTYIPKNRAFGRTGMMQLLPSVALQWETNREAIAANAAEIEDAVLSSARSSAVSQELPSETIQSGFLAFKNSFDREYAGFGNAPKFPSPHNLLFLLQYWKASADLDALDMVVSTLTAIRSGGIYDQIGFGVHRYSTDRAWLVPHFEKMLYDQSLLAIAFIESYQATGDDFFAETAAEILEYVLRDMTSPDGGFYSSEDADSQGGEGAFYTWTVQEMSAVLSEEELNRAEAYWNASDPSHILHQSGSRVISDSDRQELELIRETLFHSREARDRPAGDQKILADWNGLMIAALAKASLVLDDPRYLDSAEKAFEFIREKMTADNQRLIHSFAGGRRGSDGFLDDYAFLIWGTLELYNATLNSEYLQFAIGLQRELDLHFADQPGGGYFFTADYADTQIARLKESYDGAVPSGNSVELTNLISLWKLTGDPLYMERASGIEAAFGGSVATAPRGYSMMLSGIMYASQGGTEIEIRGSLDDPVTQDMLAVLRTSYRPWTTIKISEPLNNSAVSALVCRNGTCSLPVESVNELRDLL
ncbi:MAG: thioredoxin domain-containing protein [Candidatus Fermentibacteria bacterium]|nr:thioredoxin domain-containing protein [Candidatus Fermentibacteria bacterium]